MNTRYCTSTINKYGVINEYVLMNKHSWSDIALKNEPAKNGANVNCLKNIHRPILLLSKVQYMPNIIRFLNM